MHEKPMGESASAGGGRRSDVRAQAEEMLRRLERGPERMAAIQRYAKMLPAEKFTLALAWGGERFETIRAQIRQEHPELSPIEVVLAAHRALEAESDAVADGQLPR